MEGKFRRPAMTASVTYENPGAALDWLERVFSFERSMVLTAPNGQVVHAEMRFAGGAFHLGSVWSDHTASPRSLGGKTTQAVQVLLPEGLDAHCERARAAGAEITQEPTDQFYGDRVYRAKDLEGHHWNFAQAVKHVSREEAEKASGLKIEGWL